MRGEPHVFNQINEDYGVPKEKLRQEMEDRTGLLKWLQQKGVSDFDKVSEVISEYYKDKEAIMAMVRSEDDKSLEEIIEAEQRVDISRETHLEQDMERDRPVETEVSGDIGIHEKKMKENNPVKDLEQKLQQERKKVEDIQTRTAEQRNSDPFENSKEVEEDPFEA